jgi:hypothetical protein
MTVQAHDPAVLHAAYAISPRIVGPNDQVRLTFDLSPQGGMSDHAIASAMVNKQNLQVGALCSDITGQRAWRSRGRLVNRGSTQWRLVDVEVQDVDLALLN